QKSARAIAFEWKIGAGEGENRWSSDLEAMYGFAPGTYDGSFEMWKKVVHPDDWPAVKEAINHAVRTGEVASEYRVVHPDLSVHWLQAKGRMLFDAAGQPARMVGFMQDITQRKQAEEELHKMEQELRRAQRLEAMGTLAGGIAHDFNNILGAILGYGEMAMRNARSGTRLHRDLDSIMAAGERGRSLVDRILAFSRSGVGERIPVHVEEVVREALDQLAGCLRTHVRSVFHDEGSGRRERPWPLAGARHRGERGRGDRRRHRARQRQHLHRVSAAKRRCAREERRREPSAAARGGRAGTRGGRRRSAGAPRHRDARTPGVHAGRLYFQRRCARRLPRRPRALRRRAHR